MTKSVVRSEEHTSELQSPQNLVCRLLLEKKKKKPKTHIRKTRLRNIRPSSHVTSRRPVAHIVHCVSVVRIRCFFFSRFVFFFFLNEAPPPNFSPLPPPAPLPI